MQTLPCPTFEDAFESLKSGAADLAMIPIENTLAGRVADIHLLLPKSDLHIVGEYFLPIHFQLIAIPGTAIDNIKTVHSHIHALGQCRNIIRANGWTAQVASDTAGAARMLAESKDPAAAALAPHLAAQLYGLNILMEDVHDAAHNTTRFVVLSREPAWPSVDSGAMITSLIFQVRNVPAALYKVLGGFATNGVNMTKLESYQQDGEFTATLFYADIEGHPQHPSVSLALEEMDFFCVERRILGVYPASTRTRPKVSQ
jgi:prephenate dehydratase